MLNKGLLIIAIVLAVAFMLTNISVFAQTSTPSPTSTTTPSPTTTVTPTPTSTVPLGAPATGHGAY